MFTATGGRASRHHQRGSFPTAVTRSPVPSTSAPVPQRKNGTSEPSATAAASQSVGRERAERTARRERQGRRGIARAAAEAAAGRDVLFEFDAQRRGDAGALERAHDEVIFCERRRRAGETRSRAGSNVKPVVQTDRNHDAAQRVVTVGAAAEDFERQVQFRGRTNGRHRVTVRAHERRPLPIRVQRRRAARPDARYRSVNVSSPRIGLSGLLTIGGGVLLLAIAIGNHMGNRVLNQVAGSNGGLLSERRSRRRSRSRPTRRPRSTGRKSR